MNANSLVRFVRSCPTCGRRMQIRGSLLGRMVTCRHCNAEFVATSSDEAPGQVDEATRLMERVESMLSQSQNGLVANGAKAPEAAPNSLTS